MVRASSWRRASVLSPLQRRVAVIVSALPEAEGFALAGGGALVIRGDVDRRTRDLDFFGPDPARVDELLPAVERALAEADLSVTRVRTSAGFARLEVADDADRTELDLATDARLFAIEERDGVAVLAAEELGVDKVLAVFGRAEARDFIDLAALEERFGLQRLLDGAAAKDRGFDLGVFSAMTERFSRLRRGEFPIEDAQYLSLQRRVDVWREISLADAHRLEAKRRRPPDIGLGL